MIGRLTRRVHGRRPNQSSSANWRLIRGGSLVLRLVSKILSLLYGVFAYAAFLASLAYLGGFVTNRYTPSSIDSGVGLPAFEALRTNLALLLLFAIQHSGMARRSFKRVWTRVVPVHLERSTYLLSTALVLVAMFRYWEAMPEMCWRIDNAAAIFLLRTVSVVGIGLVLAGGLAFSHADFTGLRQIAYFVRDRAYTPIQFHVPWVYKLVRHPQMLGTILWLWATPSMSQGRLLFVIFLTLYILAGIRWEERDLLLEHGDQYAEYATRVPSLLPFVRW